MLSSRRAQEEKVKNLEKKIDSLETCVRTFNELIAELQEEVEDLRQKFQDKQDVLAEQEKEIRRWNEGIANIMNYGLDTAKAVKGGGK